MTNMKIIKIKEDHYVIVDNLEITQACYVYKNHENVHGRSIFYLPPDTDFVAFNKEAKDISVITHSTQPLGIIHGENGKETIAYGSIGYISLSEVKELIGEVDMAEISYLKKLESSNQDKNWIGYGKGVDGVSKEKWKQIYNQAIEDNKEKKYTEEDIRKAVRIFFPLSVDDIVKLDKYINSLNKQD